MKQTFTRKKRSFSAGFVVEQLSGNKLHAQHRQCVMEGHRDVVEGIVNGVYYLDL